MLRSLNPRLGLIERALLVVGLADELAGAEREDDPVGDGRRRRRDQIARDPPVRQYRLPILFDDFESGDAAVRRGAVGELEPRGRMWRAVHRRQDPAVAERI